MAKPKFTFIPNHIVISGDLPFELMNGYSFNKANDEQIGVIEQNFQQMKGIVAQSGSLPYKVSFDINQISEDTTQITTKEIDKEKWKYYVVNYYDEGVLLSKYQLASNLLDFVLEFDIFNCDIYEGQYTFGYAPDLAFRFFSDNDLTMQHDVNVDALIKINKIYERITELENDYQDILNSITLFNSLRFLSRYNGFRILGLFTVIESLLAHKPKSTESGDSIGRQVKTKVPLLSHRASEKIDYDMFGEASESTIWSKLYTYRSCLAHGVQASFEKELKVLKSPVAIHDFLIICIKKLLIQALNEPELTHDLKRC